MLLYNLQRFHSTCEEILLAAVDFNGFISRVPWLITKSRFVHAERTGRSVFSTFIFLHPSIIFISYFSPFLKSLYNYCFEKFYKSSFLELFRESWSAIAFLWLCSYIHLSACVLGLKGDGEPVEPSQGEPKAADPAGGHGTGAVEETGGAQLWEGLRWHEAPGLTIHLQHTHMLSAYTYACVCSERHKKHVHIECTGQASIH